MKKIICSLISLLICGVAFAQYGTTKAERISNGCGSEFSTASRVGSAIANAWDAPTHGGLKKQRESCDQHDKDYYNGVDKKKADSDFRDRSPVKGWAVETAKETSQKSYNAAQQDRERSQKLQPTWERENKQCLDASEYKVTYR